MSNRVARIERATKESSITVEIDLDGKGTTDIATGLPFFDHMLTAFGSHGCFDLTVHAEVTSRSTPTTRWDTAIVLGRPSPRHSATEEHPASPTPTSDGRDPGPGRGGRSGNLLRGHREPDTMLTTIIGGHYATVINHFFETLTYNAASPCTYAASTARPAHITEAEYKAVAVHAPPSNLIHG